MVADSILDYDGFNYPSGSSLAGQNGGTGWSGAWSNAQTELDVTTGAGLTFENLAASPGDAVSDAASSGLVAFFSRPLDSTYGGDDTTLYMSFLLQPEPGFGFYGGVNLGGLFVGKSGPTDTYGLEAPTNDISSSNVTAVAGTTVFLVLEAEFLPGDDEFSLFIDPTPGGAQPSTPDAFKNDYDAGPFNTLYLNNAGGWITDEIRVGTTYASVTPAATTPEPRLTWPIAILILLGIMASRALVRKRYMSR